MWGIDPEGTFNNIRFRVGRNRRSWVKNCVSIGLASCFLEPLESTGLYFTYAAIYQLAKHFPDRDFDQILIDRFNKEIADMYDESRDFLQAHFYFSPREDTPFWRANKELTLAPEIQEKAAMYRAGLSVNPPIVSEGAYYSNFEAEFRNFWTNGSYYCIFAGLGMLPKNAPPVLTYKPESKSTADEMFASMRDRQQELLAKLPTSYDYLKQLYGS
jgi:tryptophan halogenase